jgi:small-conductance mechanosensitive channel
MCYNQARIALRQMVLPAIPCETTVEAFMSEIWANDTYRKLILSALILVVQAALRRVIQRYANTRISVDSPHLYTIRKTTSLVVTIITLFLLLGIWIQRLGDLSVALGILGAGLAFALQEVIGSIAGWLTIVTGKPFTVGDRIESGQIRGDVVDIGVLRTTLAEVGNWLGGNHNTGRIVTLSNAFLFKEPLYNSSAHLNFVWDEIRIPITYESNLRRALEILPSAVREHPAYQALLPKAEKQRREARRKLAVKMTPLEPRTFVKLTDNWIELGVVYPVGTDGRRSFRSEVSQRLLAEFEAESIRVASQTIAIVEFPSSPAP